MAAGVVELCEGHCTPSLVQTIPCGQIIDKALGLLVRVKAVVTDPTPQFATDVCSELRDPA